MTEAEWLADSDPAPMLEFLQKGGTGRLACGYSLEPAHFAEPHQRKYRLVGCGYCRMFLDIFKGNKSVRIIECAERFADGQVTVRELNEARNLANSLVHSCKPEWHATLYYRYALWCLTLPEDPLPPNVQGNLRRVQEILGEQSLIVSRPIGHTSDDAARKIEASLLRDIFGNPFRPAPTIDSAWLSWHDSTILCLAQQMYDSRDFASMPILADALEEAGCTNAVILEHCRGPGPHVRGCWVVDLVLGKE